MSPGVAFPDESSRGAMFGEFAAGFEARERAGREAARLAAERLAASLDAFKPLDKGPRMADAARVLKEHQLAASLDQTWSLEDATNAANGPERRCVVCNAKPGQRHLPTGRYP